MDREPAPVVVAPPFASVRFSQQPLPTNISVVRPALLVSTPCGRGNPGSVEITPKGVEALLDRSMPPIATPVPCGSIVPRRNLRTFDHSVHAYGTYLRGFAWDLYGCGTYRSRKTQESAKHLFNAYIRRLRRSLKAPVAWFAVHERRTSGCGHPAIALHWHFLAAVPAQHREPLLRAAKLLWETRYGDAMISPYDPEDHGAFYITKLAGGGDFDYICGNLKRLQYGGPADMFSHFQTDPYVPDHVRHRVTGQTLAIR